MTFRLLIISAAFMAAGACATTGGEAEAPSASAKAEKAPSRPAFRRADLEGKSGKSIDALLGAPALVRKEGPGEFRRYAFADCSLIVILYPDEKGGLAARSLDAAAKMSGDPDPDLDRCLARGLVKPAIS